MIYHRDLSAGFTGLRELKGRIIASEISLGGNCNLNIYGTLDCHSGRRLKRENRVFFRDKSEAIANGYRPCAHCLPDEYQFWKQN